MQKRNDYNPAGLSEDERDAHNVIFRQVEMIMGMPLHVVRGLWDQCDGTNSPEGWDHDALQLALNRMGDGAYCTT